MLNLQHVDSHQTTPSSVNRKRKIPPNKTKKLKMTPPALLLERRGSVPSDLPSDNRTNQLERQAHMLQQCGCTCTCDDTYRVRQFSLSPRGLKKSEDVFRTRHSSSGSCLSFTDSMEGMHEVFRHRTDRKSSKDSGVGSSDMDYGRVYRVAILGTGGVGKSSLLKQFVTSDFVDTYDSDPFTDEGEEDEMTVCVSVNKHETELYFFCAENVQEASIPDVDAFIIVYAVADRSSFAEAEDLLLQLHKKKLTQPVVIVGNKSDLVRARTVSTHEGKLVATVYGAKHIETSAVLKHQVDELLVGVTTQLRMRSGLDADIESKLDKIKGRSGDKKTIFRSNSAKELKELLKRVFIKSDRRRSGHMDLYEL
ncbi:GTP-binding protein REM 1 [Lingula anatina]|uniref:GTP-binding protein REM 1 n=1 Tax=Lingula anatina TaxID=7574 RepID=A0A1S3IE63_LINAN|nr:GTP-binding protein REM 1 [Lingula anatina]|eukprot:XP_013396522.1 GTP-binding protein REM 1 [Lingula anatina]